MIKHLARATLTPLLKHIPTDRKWLRPFYRTTQLQLKEEYYVSPRLPATFSGLSLAYAADIHFGSYLNQERALKVVSQIQAFETDLIVLGGDYGEEARTAEAFFDLIPPFPENIPVLAAIGNHDHMGAGANIARLMEKMRAKGVTLLRNEVWQLSREGKTLAFCAPDDILAGFPDFEPLIEGTRQADFVIFMPHSPDLIPEAHKAGLSFDLALCGHTHGGQIAPGGRSIYASSRYGDRYRMGWIKEEGSDIFISCGVGTSVLPMRIGTLPEIHRFTLSSENKRSAGAALTSSPETPDLNSCA